jgi:predicted dehydrogenase
MPEIKLITLDPGHFHAALVQKEMYPRVSRRVAVYGPLGPDLLAHLNRIAQFNWRKDNPTSWELDVHCSAGFLAEMTASRPGTVVVLAGRNHNKLRYIEAAVEAGLNVLADKPWVISSKELGRLGNVLNAAELRGVVAYDIMTERYEITSILQRELVQARDIFGEQVPGSPGDPCVRMHSVHHISKLVAGASLTRPAWFFDIGIQGEGLSDVGTHLVDLVQWTLFPEQAIDHRTELTITGATRWPTELTAAQFRHVTGEPDFPPALAASVNEGQFRFYCNNRVDYVIRDLHVELSAVWNFAAPASAGDTHFAAYRGSRSRVEVRQGPEEGFRPELYVVPNPGSSIAAALDRMVGDWQSRWPEVAVEHGGAFSRITIPERYRVGHEAHFAQVARQFFAYLRHEERMPSWEKPNMLAKYFVTTRGVEQAASI